MSNYGTTCTLCGEPKPPGEDYCFQCGQDVQSINARAAVEANLSEIQRRFRALYGELVPEPDIHTQAACLVFQVKPSEVTREMRSRAKAVTFGTLYGRQL